MSPAAASKQPPAADDGKAGRNKKPGGSDGATVGSRLRRIGRWMLIVIAVLAAIPGILVPIYTVLRPISTLMIATRIVDGPIRRDWARFDDIAKVAVISVMVSEDSRFCDHHGVDWGALNEVLDDPDGPSRGASTIAMQTARNLFLWTSPSYVRKGLEIPIALYADAIWSKRRMMEIYLNIAEWGVGVFGIEAAAQHYFGRAAKDLTANQSALLAVTLPNPKVRNPAKPSRQMQSLARTVAARARIAGPYIKCLYP